MRAEEENLSWETLQRLLERLKVACELIDLAEVRSALMEAVDGFEPKEGVEDPLWDANRKDDQLSQTKELPDQRVTEEVDKKVTPLFKQ
jgi:hypothetical protein